MNLNLPTRDAAFVEKQRQCLLELGMKDLSAVRTDENDEIHIERESAEGPLGVGQIARAVQEALMSPLTTGVSRCLSR